MATFSDRLKILRKSKGVTQKQMAEFLELTERTYRAYEAGDIDPPSSKTTKLADFFEVSTDYLLGRTNHWFEDGKLTVRIPPDIFTEDLERAMEEDDDEAED